MSELVVRQKVIDDIEFYCGIMSEVIMGLGPGSLHLIRSTFDRLVEDFPDLDFTEDEYQYIRKHFKEHWFDPAARKREAREKENE